MYILVGLSFFFQFSISVQWYFFHMKPRPVESLITVIARHSSQCFLHTVLNFHIVGCGLFLKIPHYIWMCNVLKDTEPLHGKTSFILSVLNFRTLWCVLFFENTEPLYGRTSFLHSVLNFCIVGCVLVLKTPKHNKAKQVLLTLISLILALLHAMVNLFRWTNPRIHLKYLLSFRHVTYLAQFSWLAILRFSSTTITIAPHAIYIQKTFWGGSMQPFYGRQWSFIYVIHTLLLERTAVPWAKWN